MRHDFGRELVGSIADELREALRQLISHASSGATDIRISPLTRTSTGLSRENWVFDLDWSVKGVSARLPLILRRDPPGSLLQTDRVHELGVLNALAQSRLPVPRVRWSDIEGKWLGSPSLVMDIVEGDCDWHVLNGPRPLGERMVFARDFLSILIEIQNVDWKHLGLGSLLGVPRISPAVTALDQWEAERARVQRESLPELDLAGRWLRKHARVARKLTLVHGDFKPGNMLIDGRRVSAVLDWETAHIGDPLEDLGWITNPVRAAEHQIPDHWETAHIVEAYRAMTGYDFDDNELKWWNVFSCWKLAIIVITGLAEGIDGRFNRIYHSPAWLFRRLLKMMES